MMRDFAKEAMQLTDMWFNDPANASPEEVVAAGLRAAYARGVEDAANVAERHVMGGSIAYAIYKLKWGM